MAGLQKAVLDREGPFLVIEVCKAKMLKISELLFLQATVSVSPCRGTGPLLLHENLGKLPISQPQFWGPSDPKVRRHGMSLCALGLAVHQNSAAK